MVVSVVVPSPLHRRYGTLLTELGPSDTATLPSGVFGSVLTFR